MSAITSSFAQVPPNHLYMGSWKVPSILMFALVAVGIAQARPVVTSRWQSVRGMGMGQALIPFADDGPTGLFYNPAGLAKTHGVHFEPLNLGFYGNSDLVAHLNHNTMYASSLSSFGPKLSPKQGMPGFGGFILPSFYMKDFAFGALYDMRVSAEKKTDGSIHYRSQYQFIPAVGAGLRLASGVLRFGYSLQYVSKSKGDITVPGTFTPLGYNEELSQGGGLSHNLGFALTLPYEYLPSLNVVARNVATLKFTRSTLMVAAGNSSGTLDSENMQLDSAIGSVTHLGSGCDLHSSFEYRDITSQTGAPLLGKIGLGLEFAIKNSIFVRGGMNSLYPTAGMGIKRKKSEMNVAWAIDDVGTGFHSANEVKYMFQYVMRAF